MAKGFFPFFT